MDDSTTKNVVILTPGLSGSSVLTGLIARAGYWPGSQTKKIAYETYENATLVGLDRKILRAAGYRVDPIRIPPPSIRAIEAARGHLDLDEFREFIRLCEGRRPWIWKDPRLCFTIFFWAPLLRLEDCQFIFMDRDPRQSWIGLAMKKQTLMSLRDLESIQESHVRSSMRFLEKYGLDYHRLNFEELLSEPEPCLDRLSGFLGRPFSVDDLRTVYKGPLRKRWSRFDHARARLRFLIEYARGHVVQTQKNGLTESGPTPPS